MRLLPFLCSFLLLFGACNQPKQPEFKNLSSQVQFKYIQFGEGKKAALGKSLALHLNILNQAGDTLHHVPNYPYLFNLQDSPIDSAWAQLQAGDSGIFRLPRKVFNDRFTFYHPSLLDTGIIDLHFRMNKVLNNDEVESYQNALLSKREIDEQASLKKYLQSIDGELDTVGEIYRIIQTINHEGNPIKSGSEVSIHYQGSFLNGYVFEDSRTKEVTPTFLYGQEYQLIEGMQMGLSRLNEGESVKIIVPSRRGFGEEGSLAGIVPPYTTVIFDVQIVNVNNNE